MNITPRPLPQLAPVDLDTATVVLDGSSSDRSLPAHIDAPGSVLDIETTYSSPNSGEQLVNPFASTGITSDSRRVVQGGFADALSAAQQVSRLGESEMHAIVQDATDGARYIVPLDIWEPVDESPYMWEDVGGTPHETADGYVRISKSVTEPGFDLEALVMDGGSRWVNMTGHPIRLPKA